MCGIAGCFNFSEVEIAPNEIVSMVQALKHRGPNDNGVWQDQNVALGQTRLSIIDLKPTGHQPMISLDGNFVLVFNGEIYNYKELARQLQQENVVFEITGDTRVLLEACAHWGIEKTLPKLNGMFAFALYDKREKSLLVARDRFGEKPLYYTNNEHRFAFASELKALKTLSDFNSEIDKQALALYLRFNYIPCPYSIYKSCRKLFPGHYLTIKSKNVTEKCYYSIEDAFKNRTLSNSSEVEYIDILDNKLQKSVKDRMISDVPIGAFLSGGIDSSLMVALMQSQSNSPIKTFTVGFKDSSYDESQHAEAIAKHLGTDHTTVYISPEELWSDAHKIVDIYDEPFGDASALSTYFISKQFKKYVSVAIGGDGGDELFLGYHRQKWIPYLSKISKFIPHFFLELSKRANSTLFPGNNSILGTKINKGLQALQGKGFLETYLNSVSYWSIKTDISNTWFAENNALKNNAEQVAYLDLRTFLHDDVLCKVDRASMAVSLETRAPFLDYELFEFAASIPLAQKFKNHTKKYLLKQVLNKYVPQSLWNRPKMGFGMPLDHAFRTSLKPNFESLLRQDTIIWEYLDKMQVKTLWCNHLSNRQNNELLLWNFYVAQMFLQKQ